MPRGKNKNAGKKKNTNRQPATGRKDLKNELRNRIRSRLEAFDFDNPEFKIERFHPENPPLPETPHRVCVWIMVHNEAPYIEKTLVSSSTVADCFVVGDTGSDDGTVEKCIEVCKTLNKPLYVIELGEPQYPCEFPFFNFAAYRNRILAFAEQIGEWLLAVDSSDEIRNGEYLPQILDQIPEKSGAIMVRLLWGNHSHSFQRLLRAKSKLRYCDARHNYLNLTQKIRLKETTADAGEITLELESEPPNWSVGDKIEIVRKITKEDEVQPHSESRIIESIEGHKIVLDKPLEQKYYGTAHSSSGSNADNASLVIKRADQGDARDAGFYLFQDRTGSKSSANKYSKDAAYFQWRMDQGLSNDRVAFYLAQSLKDSASCLKDTIDEQEKQILQQKEQTENLGVVVDASLVRSVKENRKKHMQEMSQAYNQYRLCSQDRRQWIEQIYMSHYYCGQLSRNLGMDLTVTEKHFRDAYDTIATPLTAIELHRVYRDIGRPDSQPMGPHCNTAQVWIMAACYIPNPKLSLQDKPRDLDEKRWALLGSSSTFAGDARTAVDAYIRAQQGHLKHREEWERKAEEENTDGSYYGGSFQWMWNQWGAKRPELFAQVPLEFLSEKLRKEVSLALEEVKKNKEDMITNEKKEEDSKSNEEN